MTTANPQPITAEPAEGRRWWYPLKEFLVHTITGTCLFVIIAAPAVGLHLLVHWLRSQELAVGVTYGLEAAEYGLFGADLILFFRFLYVTSKRAWKTM